MVGVDFFGVKIFNKYTIKGNLKYLGLKSIRHLITVYIITGNSKIYFTDSILEYEIDENNDIQFRITSDYFDAVINRKKITASERGFTYVSEMNNDTYQKIKYNILNAEKTRALLVTKIIKSTDKVYEILAAKSTDMFYYTKEIKIGKKKYEVIEKEIDPDTTDEFKTERKIIESYF